MVICIILDEEITWIKNSNPFFATLFLACIRPEKTLKIKNKKVKILSLTMLILYYKFNSLLLHHEQFV